MNTIREKLRKKEVVIGSWMQLPGTASAEIMGQAGYDWIAIDLEHGNISVESIPSLCLALENGNTVPFARVAEINSKDIKQAIEGGVRGLIFPMVKNAQELEKAINFSFYPPFGERGVGFSRANLYGKNFTKHVDSISNDLVIIAQIEHIDSVNALDDILSVKRLDGIMIGPYDLSASMGLTADFEHPEFIAVIKKIKQKADLFQCPLGLHIVDPDPEILTQKINEGFRFIAYGIDGLFLHKYAECPESKNTGDV